MKVLSIEELSKKLSHPISIDILTNVLYTNNIYWYGYRNVFSTYPIKILLDEIKERGWYHGQTTIIIQSMDFPSISVKDYYFIQMSEKKLCPVIERYLNLSLFL
jgi:hypothetical protein